MFTIKNSNGNERTLYTLKISYTIKGKWYYLESHFIGLSGLHNSMKALYRTIHDERDSLNGSIHKVTVEEMYISGYWKEY